MQGTIFGPKTILSKEDEPDLGLASQENPNGRKKKGDKTGNQE